MRCCWWKPCDGTVTGPEARRVETATAFREALTGGEWDIVLADFSLPAFGAPEALRILKAEALDIPFIVVSGTITEEMAVSMMRAGAHDFIHKNNLARLLPAIAREMQEARERAARRTAEASLRLSDSRFKSIFDSNVIGVFFADIQGHIVDANAAFLRMVGYDREDLLAGRLNWITLTPPEWQHQNAWIAAGLMPEGKKLSGYEKQYLHKDGHRIDAPIEHAQGGGAAQQGLPEEAPPTERLLKERLKEECVCCVMDITERKKKKKPRRPACAKPISSPT